MSFHVEFLCCRGMGGRVDGLPAGLILVARLLLQLAGAAGGMSGWQTSHARTPSVFP
jgi:hypothetical protein